MKQTSLSLGNSIKRTRKREFLTEMERVVSSVVLVELVAPFAHDVRRCRPVFGQGHAAGALYAAPLHLSCSPMKEAPRDGPLFREFAGLGGWRDRLPDQTTIPRHPHLLEEHKLAHKILRTVTARLLGKGLIKVAFLM